MNARIVIAGTVAALTLTGCSGSDVQNPVSAPPPPTKSSEAVTATPTTIPGNGIWKVGIDISPGEYRVSNAGSTCYWARLSGTSGTVDDIITNGLGSEGPLIVTIDPADVAFKTERCGTWEKTS